MMTIWYEGAHKYFNEKYKSGGGGTSLFFDLANLHLAGFTGLGLEGDGSPVKLHQLE